MCTSTSRPMRRPATSPTWRTCSPTAATASLLTRASSRIPSGSRSTPISRSTSSSPTRPGTTAFVQAETRGDGWANQLSQRALYDYLTNNQNDPLYPGGGSNAYNDGAILASYYSVNSSNDSAFLSTYNANPAPSTDGGSPVYFSNSASINGYSIGQGWVGLRDVQISNAFKTAFGETNVNAVDTNSRVRPVFEWQYGGGWTGALGFISSTYGAQHPVNYYLYGGGGGWYADNNAGGFSDVSFANPAFADGLTGWSSSGSAGVVANGSTMGNPNAPPLFSAIAVTNGATESGNTVTITTTTPHNFVVGQSVTVSGVTVGGYNGTFTITSVTSTTFTYNDSTTGLANSGDGIVTGTGTSTQTAYLQPGASISQNVTFIRRLRGHHAVCHPKRRRTVLVNGLTITLTPTNGGPAINNGQPISRKRGCRQSYSGNQNRFRLGQDGGILHGRPALHVHRHVHEHVALRHGLLRQCRHPDGQWDVQRNDGRCAEYAPEHQQRHPVGRQSRPAVRPA